MNPPILSPGASIASPEYGYFPPFGFNITMWVLLHVILHVGCAIGVFNDAMRLRSRDIVTFGLGPFLWFAAALVLGPVGLGIYWLIHHSTLSRVREGADEVELQSSSS